MRRRALMIVAAATPWPARATTEDDIAARLAAGGAVMAFRHALAPGTYDPPGFRLDDCSTQRNLNDQGRAQAQRIGEWFRRRGLVPAAVRSSPWCRCLDTARLAFGRADPWAALGSPRAAADAASDASGDGLRRALVAATARRGRFEVWVSHQFVLSALVGGATASGEGLLLDAASDGTPRILGRLAIE
ncbi:histidine phosphatase family protein [Aquincola sp. S2]|uniref:Histidine phosphatase family protein n=1 Tax=Pseudaquabacterium terrae TaxID=2732868 RepID=A0ABX2E935_9BURK|nr:histidine phosphatase family protein [Aquabacterium terrae]NRF65449.1 histidine phosphatase family protein [Aquabacterium terrae]